MSMDVEYLLQLDKEAMDKLASIDTPLLCIEHEFILKLCALADKADLDRRIALKASLSAMEYIYDTYIMAC